LPLVYVVITAVAWGDAYGQDGLCWLDSGNGGIWLFVAPALVAVVVNLVLLVRIIRVVHPHQQVKPPLAPPQMLKRRRGTPVESACTH